MLRYEFDHDTPAEEIKRQLIDEGVSTIDLKYIDLPGRWHHLTLPVEGLNEKIFTKGVGFDGSSIPGFQRDVTGGDMVMLPDKTTAMEDVFWEERCVSFICDCADAATGEPFTGDPRGVAKRAVAYAKQFFAANETAKTAGAADGLFSPEFEFFVFDDVVITKRDQALGYRLDCEEADWNFDENEFGNSGFQLRHQAGYHAVNPADKTYDLRNEIVRLLIEMGIPVKYHHHEVGGPGQCEIELLFERLVTAADNGMWTKYIIHNLAYQYGRSATFMPKPIYGVAGNGMHVHQYLIKDDGHSAFAGEDETGFNALARAYTAGILKHGRSLAAVTNASTNSYKRLVEGYEAPVWLFYGMANREAACRVPAYAAPAKRRVEFRSGDATANLYLMLAAMLMAGIDGIERGLDPSAEGFGPYGAEGTTRMAELTGQERKDHVMPRDFTQALHALERDHDYLMRGGVFDEPLIEAYLRYKYDHELAKILNRPHPYELFLYYDL
ncbi:MAG: type I glutamate--ammonia ligase [Candidatus Coatesbacteria bacterium]|nr:type I glutamate--ammonia ligase [Candidatus Coatesbacteria bacterium]